MRVFLAIIFVSLLISCKPRKIVRYTPVQVNEFDTCVSKDCLERAIALNPKSEKLFWRLGNVYQSERKYQQALECYSHTITANSSYNVGYPYRDRANCKNNLGNDTGALNDINRAIELNPEERYFYTDRGDYLCNLERYELALLDYSKALSIFDSHRLARLGRAKTFVKLRMYQEALNDYKVLSDTSNFSVYDYYFRGLARFHSRDIEGACEDWSNVAEVCTEAKDSIQKHCRVQ